MIATITILFIIILAIAESYFKHQDSVRKEYRHREELDEEALVFLKKQLLDMGYTPNAGVPMERDFYTQNAYLAGIRYGRNNP